MGKKKKKRQSLNVTDEKHKAYVATLTQAWLATTMERDKSILAISSLAIGFIVSLGAAAAVSTVTELLVLASAAILFAVAVVSAVLIFTLNQGFLEKKISEEEPDDCFLRVLDWLLLGAFMLGFVCLLAFGGIKAASFLRGSGHQTDRRVHSEQRQQKAGASTEEKPEERRPPDGQVPRGQVTGERQEYRQAEPQTEKEEVGGANQ